MPSVEVERVCQGCGCGYSEDDASSTDGDFCSDCCCWECVSERDSDDESPGGILHSYDYVPSLFWWERSGPRPRPTTATPYLGVELEVEAGTMGALSQVVDSAEGSYPAQYWCKHDGSLYDYGCEIVTHPATLEAHREQMAWPDVLGKLRTLRVRSWDRHLRSSRPYQPRQYDAFSALEVRSTH